MKKIKALLYCTKAKPYLYRTPKVMNFAGTFFTYSSNKNLENCTLNGTILCECEIEVEEIKKGWGCLIGTRYYRKSSGYPDYELEQKSCLSFDKMNEYLNGTLNEKSGYALHISNLKVFDKPKALSEYVYRTCLYGNCSTCKHYETANCSAMQFPIKKAPQNMMCAFECIGDGGYINLDEVSKEPYILISIQPQWLCKILNGEKDIEIRKQVLNCMKGNE